MTAPARVVHKGRAYNCMTGQTILEALLQQGANLVWSCRQGSCGCCAMRLVEGSVQDRHGGALSADDGHILPCISVPQGDVILAAADPGHAAMAATLHGRRVLGADVVALDIVPASPLSFQLGQHVWLVHADVVRPYSIVAGDAHGTWFRIHVRRVHDGQMSNWLCDDAAGGAEMLLRGPGGAMYYRPSMAGRSLLLLATGSGAGALAGIATAALEAGHTGEIHLFHGSACDAGLYLRDDLTHLADVWPQFHYHPSRCNPSEGAAWHDFVTQSLALMARRMGNFEAFLCGSPSMVVAARVALVSAGVDNAHIHADAFSSANERTPPHDGDLVQALPADAEMWAALECGPRLTRILTDFYEYVYADDLLMPFFVGIARERVIAKQYEFLASIWTGKKNYLGMNPHNAHHWMVISDELFDHREAVFKRALVEHELEPGLIHRWLALHEMFRSVMVKTAPRGLMSHGVELPVHSNTLQRLEIDTVCDGCSEAIPAGEPSRYHHRVGNLHCAQCGVIDVTHVP